jgi:hypothetical protein
MNDSGKKHASPFDKNGDGVRITEHGAKGSGSVLFYKLMALVLVGCFAFYFVKMAIDRVSSNNGDNHSNSSVSDESERQAAEENDIASSPSSRASSMGNRQLVARPAQAYDSNDLSNYVAAGQAPKMEEVIERLHDAGIHTGLGAFNPPGTSPPMIGLAVPEDYVLPEGYVRHYQATDDGQRIEPILMYSPDFEFFDSNGRPISIPDNRVVPGNMAPPGFVIRPIEIPRPLEPGKP